MSAVRAVDLTVRLGDREVVRNAAFEVTARTVAVVGDNGSGKSTLARAIAGLVHRSAGELEVLGRDPDRDAAALRRRVALVLSDPDAQILMPTVAEDVSLSLRAENLSRAERSARVAAALTRFGLSDLADRPAHDLSGGQKQLLALCGAFVRAPDLVVADEPTAFLDGRNARIVADHLLADTGHALVLVTHDLSLARRCAQALLVEDGRVVASGSAVDVVAEYETALAC
ncbi:energy-coupling factor ABC transporter ATP-binding protein [Microbacterium testaceum]|uniref:ABC transporter ATP-binding protein n=1 Tax=Microbacterium testaceum TaxID=2033 RepID=A0A2T7W7L0_MICTE|nr:ABC transporter ATP-binding protein [Microbacterium testaceum]PVE66848.1 ABC transporter ATP-binding protein [Microbacterium testaceum]